MKHTFDMSFPVKVEYDDETQKVEVECAPVPRHRLPDGGIMEVSVITVQPIIHRPRERATRGN